MNKVKATFYLSEEIAELINRVAFQNQMKKSTLVEQALKEYFLPFTTKAYQLKRFHELVDKRLDGNLSPSERAELQALEAAFNEADAALMARHQQWWEAQNASYIAVSKELEQALRMEQLKEIGKKLDELLHQFVDKAQSRKES